MAASAESKSPAKYSNPKKVQLKFKLHETVIIKYSYNIIKCILKLVAYQPIGSNYPNGAIKGKILCLSILALGGS